MTDCLLCTEPLTIKNVVNTNCCNLPCCKDCFFRWTKVKNTCPCCRANIFCNSDENKEIMNLKELLSHRTTIVRQVEESYDDLDRIRQDTIRQVNKREKVINTINGLKEELSDLIIAKKGSYLLIKHLEIRMRNRLENIRNQTKNNKERVNNHIKQQCLCFLRASYKNPERFQKFPYFSIAFKNFIKQNHKSKLRMKFRNKMNNLKLPENAIRELFSEGISSSFYPINFSDLFRSNSTVTNDRFISQYIENNPGQNQEELENAFMRYFLGNR